jgi:hypothetical protein
MPSDLRRWQPFMPGLVGPWLRAPDAIKERHKEKPYAEDRYF